MASRPVNGAKRESISLGYFHYSNSVNLRAARSETSITPPMANCEGRSGGVGIRKSLLEAFLPPRQPDRLCRLKGADWLAGCQKKSRRPFHEADRSRPKSNSTQAGRQGTLSGLQYPSSSDSRRFSAGQETRHPVVIKAIIGGGKTSSRDGRYDPNLVEKTIAAGWGIDPSSGQLLQNTVRKRSGSRAAP
jgi:hypothetical protein